MECKNCDLSLHEEDAFCNHCGAKVVRERLTIRSMMNQLTTEVLGWDNKYLKTLRDLVFRPRVMLQSYIDGTRKRYMNPLGFLLIGLSIALFTFNFFYEEYLDMSMETSKVQFELMAEYLGGSFKDENFQKVQLEEARKGQATFLKYYNLILLIIIPFYGFLSKLTFGKPLNYAEHLTVNTYLQGISFLGTTACFLLALGTYSWFFYLSIFLTIIHYCYAYGRLYQLGFGQIILKLITFISLFIAAFVGIIIAGGIIGYLLGRFGLISG